MSVNPIADYETSGGADPGGVLAPESPLHEDPYPDYHLNSAAVKEEKAHALVSRAASEVSFDDEDGRLPTDEELKTLRLVPADLPKTAYLICLIEFSERASYYGCFGVFSNFIQRGLPNPGNGWGAPSSAEGNPGALGMGLQAASALTTLFSFLAYVIPIAGGILSDVKWGRYKTLWFGTLVGIVGHALLIVSAIPDVIRGGKAIAPFILGLLTLAGASGLIKPTVSPLIADQSPIRRQEVHTLPSGERVIMDPGATLSRALLIFYWCINVGAFLRLGCQYAERRVGFWLAYLVPMIAYMIMPAVLLYLNPRIIRVPPQGSVVIDAAKVSSTVLVKRSWAAAKPEAVVERTGVLPKYDDDFVFEVKRALKACSLFLVLIPYNLADGGLSSVITSMAGEMEKRGIPNDLMANWNALTIIFAIPIFNYVIYPGLRKLGINFSPVKRMTAGLLMATLTMVVAAILQWQVYKQSPCGYRATNCPDGVAPISIWAQIPIFSLPALGEIFINVTAYELAITRAPQRMKGLVYAIMLLMNAFSSAIVLIITPALKDPDLIWPFVGIAAVNFVAMNLCYFGFRKMDHTEGRDVAVGADRKIEGIQGPAHKTDKTKA